MISPLREIVGKAILARFEESYQRHGVSFDPDTAWEAADDVIAALVSALTEQECIVRRPVGVIGSLGFTLAEPTE